MTIRYLVYTRNVDCKHLMLHADPAWLPNVAPPPDGPSLCAVLQLFAFTGNAHAARSGGRMGGSGFSSSFRGSASSMSRSSGSSLRSPSMGSSFGGSSSTPFRSRTTVVSASPVVMPFMPISPFGYGYYSGSSMLFTMFAVGLLGYLAVQAVRGANDDMGGAAEPCTVARLQIGLLAIAKDLKDDLDALAYKANTSTPEGLQMLLQETVLALLRNPGGSALLDSTRLLLAAPFAHVIQSMWWRCSLLCTHASPLHHAHCSLPVTCCSKQCHRRLLPCVPRFNADYIAYGNASTSTIRGEDAAEREFNALSLSERSKFESETLSNVGGVMKNKSLKAARSSGEGTNELLVVSILVAAEGNGSLPAINSLADVKAALTRLGGLGAGQLMAVEVLWTPQAEGDYFTRDDIALDYPNLVPV